MKKRNLRAVGVSGDYALLEGVLMGHRINFRRDMTTGICYIKESELTKITDDTKIQQKILSKAKELGFKIY